jgi:hypothetical protein
MRTPSSKLRRALSLALIYLLAVSSGPAELPPSAYRERQENSPEVLMIKVRSVRKRETKEAKWKQIDFTVEAEVQKVTRSASKLTPGTVIEIRYAQRHYSQPIAGPSEVPALKEGQICPAYLSGDGKMYSPAAGGYSFETVN